MKRSIQLAAMALACSCAMTGAVRASTIVTFTDGISTTDGFEGQSVTTPAGGPFDHITFNFYADPAATVPLAPGDLFLLTQEYLGLPPDLSSSTPGFLAQSTGVSSGVYLFDPSVTLQGGTQYFFSHNENFNKAWGRFYPGGMEYFTGASFANFQASPTDDVLFNLSGTEVTIGPTVPEPASLTLLGLGLAGMGARRWRQRKA